MLNSILDWTLVFSYINLSWLFVSSFWERVGEDASKIASQVGSALAFLKDMLEGMPALKRCVSSEVVIAKLYLENWRGLGALFLGVCGAISLTLEADLRSVFDTAFESNEETL